MVTGIILASGFSRRMTQDKLLLEIEGTPIIEKVMRAAVNSDIDDLIIVYREACIKDIADKYKLLTVVNDQADLGQSQSIKLGVHHASCHSDAYLFLTGDQPFMTSEVINKVIQRFGENPNQIIVPLYAGKRGNPVLFPAHYKEMLLELDGDIGGRKIIESEIENVYFEKMNDLKAGLDIDTWEEYVRLTNV